MNYRVVSIGIDLYINHTLESEFVIYDGNKELGLICFFYDNFYLENGKRPKSDVQILDRDIPEKDFIEVLRIIGKTPLVNHCKRWIKDNPQEILELA
jgi:hypothetical protein